MISDSQYPSIFVCKTHCKTDFREFLKDERDNHPGAPSGNICIINAEITVAKDEGDEGLFFLALFYYYKSINVASSGTRARAHTRTHTHTHTGFVWFLTEGKTGEIHEFASKTKALRHSWLSAIAQNLKDMEHEELFDSIPVLQITDLSALEDDWLTLSRFGMLPSQGDTDASAQYSQPRRPGASASAMRQEASFKRMVNEPTPIGNFETALVDQIESTPSEEEERQSQTLPIGFRSEARQFAHTPGCVFTIKTVPLSIYLSLFSCPPRPRLHNASVSILYINTLSGNVYVQVPGGHNSGRTFIFAMDTCDECTQIMGLISKATDAENMHNEDRKKQRQMHQTARKIAEHQLLQCFLALCIISTFFLSVAEAQVRYAPEWGDTPTNRDYQSAALKYFDVVDKAHIFHKVSIERHCMYKY